MIIHVIFTCDASYYFSENVSYRMSKRGEKRREEKKKLGNQRKFVEKKRKSFTRCPCIPENQIVG